MFNLLNNPPVPSNDVSAFFSLLELVSNPEHVKARLCELANAVMEANEAVGVNRRPNLTPDRRPILTPSGDGFWR